MKFSYSLLRLRDRIELGLSFLWWPLNKPYRTGYWFRIKLIFFEISIEYKDET